MHDFTFKTTPSIRMAPGGAARLGEILAAAGLAPAGAAVLFVTDPGILRLGLAAAALADLEAQGFAPVVFDAIEPDPKAATVEDAAAQARAVKAACVIGFGGGSSMDVAKVAAKFVAKKEECWARDGLGHWAFLANDRYLGWGGFQREGSEWDFGLVLKPEAFGLGSRISRKAIDLAIADERIPFATFLLPPTRKNLGALERLGAKRVGEIEYDGQGFSSSVLKPNDQFVPNCLSSAVDPCCGLSERPV